MLFLPTQASPFWLEPICASVLMGLVVIRMQNSDGGWEADSRRDLEGNRGYAHVTTLIASVLGN